MVPPPLTFIREFSRQSKTENVAPRGNRYVLLRVHRVAHGRSRNGLAGMEVPQRLTGLGIHGFKRLRVIAEEKQTAGSRHDARRRAAFAGLHVSPNWFVTF